MPDSRSKEPKKAVAPRSIANSKPPSNQGSKTVTRINSAAKKATTTPKKSQATLEREEREREAALARWRERMADLDLVHEAFDRNALKRVCEMHEDEFEKRYGLERVEVEQAEPANFYYFKDNDSDILAVAHLDTVVDHARRLASFAETTEGLVIHSGALDDRLGAYIILELLPALGITFDWLLTVGEEKGKSTAGFFDPEGREYLWGIEFDRGNNDVVMYCYDDFDTKELVRECGARPGHGSFSDIAYLEHLEMKCFNWGVCYQDYHTTRGYAYLEDTFEMLTYFMKFHRQNNDTYLPHEKKKSGRWGGGSGLYGYASGGSSYQTGSYGKKEDEKTQAEKDAEWWRTKRDSLKEYDLYDPYASLGGHEEIDDETKQILAEMDEALKADEFLDLDVENPLDLSRFGEDSYDTDPDFVGPLPIEQRRAASSEIGD